MPLKTEPETLARDAESVETRRHGCGLARGALTASEEPGQKTLARPAERDREKGGPHAKAPG